MAGTATIPGADVSSCTFLVNGTRITATVAGEVSYRLRGTRNEDIEDAQTGDTVVLAKHVKAFVEFGALLADQSFAALSGAQGVTLQLVLLNGHTLTGTGGKQTGDPIEPNATTGMTNAVRFGFNSLVDANRNT